MSTELARLIVRLEAQSSQYDASLKKATRELNKFRNETTSSLGKIQKQFSAFGANLVKTFALGSITAAVYGLTRSVGEAIKAGDDLAKFAQKTGLTAEAASELAHAAKMADLDLTQFATGIKKMQVEISKAGSSAKGTSPALDALGLTFAKLEALNPDQQFEAIAEQIHRLKTPADQTRASVELFGKAGADLLPMFEEGAAGIRAARLEAISLGRSLSAIDLKKLQEADDAIKRMSASTSALSTSFASLISGPLTAAADKIRMVFGGATEEEKLEEKLFAAKSFVNSLGHAITSPLGIKALEDYAAALEALTEFKIDRTVGKTALPLGSFEAPGFKDIAAASDQMKAALERQAQAVKDLEEEYRVLGNTLENTLAIDASRLTAPLMTGDLTRDVLPGLESLSGKLQNISNVELPDMGEAFKTTVAGMSVYADEAARNMQDAFANFLFDPFEHGLKGMLESFVDTLRQMLANAMAADIFKALGIQPGSTSGISGLLGGLFGMGGGGAGSVSNVATAFTTVPGLASGGPVRGGSAYMVGEKGPELFIPGASGNIVPNGGGLGTTIAPVYNIDARGATTDLVKALPALFQENNRRLMEALRDARSRGQF